MPKLAIAGGAPVRTAPWPRWPVHDSGEEEAVLQVLRRGEWGGFPMPNERAARFARSFASYHDCRYGQCVANGTVSLEIALQAMGVEPGAEVIVPDYTFEATAAAVLFAGCVPILVDVEADTYCLSPAAVEAAVTPRTQALIPVHLAMNIADMDRLGSIAARHGLKVLEDCAHAHGAKWKGRGVGSLGDAGSFSFQTSKLMTAGEGGMVTTNDAATMDALFAFTNCGRQRPERQRDVPVVGHNYRMTDLQAAVLELQLQRLESQHEVRNRHMAYLDDEVRKIQGLLPLKKDPRITRQAAYSYVFRYDPQAFGIPRDVFVAALVAEGVPADGRFYEPLHRSELLQVDGKRYPAWAQRSQEPRCPVSRRAAYEEAVWLPHHLFLGSRRDTEEILQAIHKVCRHTEELRQLDPGSIQAQTLSRARRSEGDGSASG